MIREEEVLIINEEKLSRALEHARPHIGEGRVASYIPELSKADANDLGICVHTIDGQRCRFGDWERRFTIQSISKVINLAVALEHSGADAVFKRIRMEPSGSAFNSMQRISDNEDVPFNPMVNAGAITVCDLLLPLGIEKMIEISQKLCMDEGITLNEEVFESEWANSARNHSLAYLLQSKGVVRGNVEEVLRLYTQMCSLNVTAESLASLALLLANGGVHPETGRRILEEDVVKTVVTVMLTCGMYDGSGEFAVRVGLPSKSGVGGGILSVVPGEMGIGVYGPSLDEKGNSIAGQKALEFLSHHERLHILDRCADGRKTF